MAYLSEGSKVGGKQIETVDGAQAKVNALKNNEVEPLKTRVSNAEKSINQISNEVSSKVSRTEFESLQIGGRNLLRNSDFSQGKTWWTGISEIVDGYKGYKGAVLERSGYSGSNRGFLSQTSSSGDLLTEGETYTLSGWFYIDSSIPLDSKNNAFIVRKYHSSIEGAYRDIVDFPVTLDEFSYDTWYYFKATGTVPEGFNGREQVSFALGKNGRVIVSALKLEKGNKATDWTPAPEDIFQEITKVDAHANRKDNPHNVTSEQINLIPTVTDASISGDSYPIGLTVFSINTESTGYPYTRGTVFTIKYNNIRLTQWFFINGFNDSTGAWFRHWHTETGWTSWQKVATTEDVDSHANRKDNPHGVTKAQVGLGSVENYGIATQAEAEAGTANDKYMTPLRTMQLLNKKIHVGSSPPSNPRQGDLWIW